METGTGTHIGRYEVYAEIGRGAMGLVYQAHDPKIDRLVAIKTISLMTQEIEEEQEFRERFFLEAKAAGRLVHPGIVTIFDVGEEPDTHEPYIVMEFVAGQSLNRILVGENRRLPLGPALQITQEIAAALNYAHSQNVIHRDIKPANILITKDGHAKIADFGIAKLNQGLMTIPGQVLGSPAYMAPEQLSGEGADARSDLFSLGVILYSMLTGFRPFQGNSAATVSFKVVNRDPLPVTSFDSEFPAELDRLVSRAIAKDPEQRYQNGAEMAQEIQRLRERLNLLDQTAASLPTVMDPAAATIKQLARSTTPRPLASAASASGSSSGSALSSTSRPTSSTKPVVAASVRSQPTKAVPRRLALTTTALLAKFPKEMILTAAGVLFLAIAFIAIEAIRPAKHKSGRVNAPAAHHVVADTKTGASAASDSSSAAIDKLVEANAQESQDDLLVQASQAKPRPIPKAKKVAPKTRPVPKTTLPVKMAVFTPTPQPAAPLPASAALQIQIEYQFAEAEASVWVDNELIYAQKLYGESKKRALLFKKVEGHERGSAKVPTGEHRLHVRIVSASEQYDQSQTIDGNFTVNSKNVLTIVCDKHTDSMQLVLN